MSFLAHLFTKEHSTKEIFKIYIFFIVIFTIIYTIMYNYDNKSLEDITNSEKKLSQLDILYYTITTQTTIGYGDILPRTTFAKIINMTHLLIIMYLLI